MKRLVPALLACLAALLPGDARAQALPCGLPADSTLWVEYAGAGVEFRDELFGRPGIVAATNGVARGAGLRALGAHTVYWHMNFRSVVGKPLAPADPAAVRAATDDLLARAVATTGCATPVIALNELSGVHQPAPWPPSIAQYRQNVLDSLRRLAERGARPYLLVPGTVSGAKAPFTGGPAAQWWRDVAKVAHIVKQMHFNAPYFAKRDAVIGSRMRRLAMREAVGTFLDLGIPGDRLGLLLGFQSGLGKGGREGLRPRAAWFEIVKREALAARQVAGDLGLASVWSWGWGTFGPGSEDPDKPDAACVYLWARDQGLCNGPAAGGARFDTSVTAGQIVLAPGVHCSTSIGSIGEAAVAELAAALGDRALAVTALLTRLALKRLGGPVNAADLAAGEQAVVDASFGGSVDAYLAHLASAGASRDVARQILADQFRRQGVDARSRLRAPGLSSTGWLQRRHKSGWRTAICSGDEVPGARHHRWNESFPALQLPEAWVAFRSTANAVRRGRPARLVGAAVSSRARELVTVYAKPAGEGGWQKVGSIAAQPDESWRLRVSPSATTTYFAASKSAASGTVTVRVTKR